LTFLLGNLPLGEVIGGETSPSPRHVFNFLQGFLSGSPLEAKWSLQYPRL
jgi:hypothetical protein